MEGFKIILMYFCVKLIPIVLKGTFYKAKLWFAMIYGDFRA